MPLHPDVPYDPSPSVTPTTGSGDDYLHAQANPNDFGAQIGGAAKDAGKQVEDLAGRLQGMIAETTANTAETDYVTRAGVLRGKFESLEGMAAQAALPQYQKDMTDLRNSIRSNLTGAAAIKMFDSNTYRQNAYAISDAIRYGATQVKKATLESNNAIAETAVSRAGDPAVANDDTRFGENIGDIKHSIVSMMDLQGYGQYATTDPNTGRVSFDDSTPEGKGAKAVYQSELDKRTGAAWENRLRALADQNVPGAYQKFQDNRSQIPGEAQVKLDAFFQPKIRDYQTRNIADSTFSKYDRMYHDQTFGPTRGAGGMDVADSIHYEETRGKPDSAPSSKGAQGGWQILPSTFDQYKKPGEVITNPKDNEAVGRRIVDDLKSKYPNDPARVAVGYFSGTGNVAPAGSATPWIRNTNDGGESVSDYVKNVTGRVGSVPPVQGPNRPQWQGPVLPEDSPLVPSRAGFYQANAAKMIEEARQQARAQQPDDPKFEDNAVSRITTRIDAAISEQTKHYQADSDTLWKAVSGVPGQKPGITSVDELAQNPDPMVRATWTRVQSEQPKLAERLEQNIIATNAKGSPKDSREYGRGFYTLFRAVHSPSESPGHITNPAQLYSHVGENGDLTMAGLDRLTKEISGRGTPEGESESAMRLQTFKVVKNMLSGADEGLGIKDPKGEELFAKAMPLMYKALEDGKAKGLSAGDLFDPDSKNWVGNVARPLKRPLAQQTSDLYHDYSLTPTPAAPRTLAAILQDVQSKKIDAEAGKAEALRLGLIQPDAASAKPQVPRPE